MMSDPLLKILQDSKPRFNDELCEGLAFKQLQHVIPYMDKVMSAMTRSLPEGTVYKGYHVCTPLEQFNHQASLPGRRNLFDMSPSDVIMVQYHLEWCGQAIKPLKQLLPFSRRHGIINIRNATFFISPAMVDNLMSIESHNIFIPFTKNRTNFSSLPVSFMRDDIPVMTDTAWSYLFNVKEPESNKQRKSTLVHYLFAYNGVTGTFKKFFNATVKVGDETKINDTNLNPSEWVICSSNGNSFTRKTLRGAALVKSNFRLAVKRAHYNEDMDMAIGGFFYICDHMSELGFMTADELDNPMTWVRALSRFIFKNIVNEKKTLEQMQTHLKTLLHYIDELVLEKIKYERLPIKNMEDLMFYMIQNFGKLTMKADVADTSNKCLVTVPFVLFDLVVEIHNLMYETKRLTGHRANAQRLEKALVRFPTDKILNIGSGHGEVSTLETATDCMLYRVTGPVITQEKATGKTVESNSIMNNPSFKLHPSVFLTNSYPCISKSSPTGQGKVNPFARFDNNYKFLPNPELEPLISNMTDLLAGKGKDVNK